MVLILVPLKIQSQCNLNLSDIQTSSFPNNKIKELYEKVDSLLNEIENKLKERNFTQCRNQKKNNFTIDDEADKALDTYLKTVEDKTIFKKMDKVLKINHF
ncbi:CLUMA_CG000995, isoform A [Clunio marinus]|uniref:CLUMA_CG000995, isoform A n=1 Tax=Clunio marinus TaxID=568069 RepID=A0A1J1HL58_9DIPT|nr:CLUMA_CG000995, isoform A [Clunio marinus]